MAADTTAGFKMLKIVRVASQTGQRFSGIILGVSRQTETGLGSVLERLSFDQGR
jgi:hypothetical protein